MFIHILLQVDFRQPNSNGPTYQNVQPVRVQNIVNTYSIPTFINNSKRTTDSMG